MLKNKLQQVPDNIHFADMFEENKFIHWISTNIKWLLGIIALLFFAVILFFKFSGKSSGSAEKDYFSAETQVALLVESQNTEALDNLTEVLKRRTELQSKYDGIIAQVLLNREEVDKAAPFANRSLKRTAKNDLPFYGDYARTSFAIAAKNYQEALKAALDLKDKMATEKPKSFGDILYLYNLLRIALLQQQLGLKKDELQTWKEFKEASLIGGAYVVEPKAFERVIQQLQEGKLSIFNYIEEREKSLKT